MNVSFRRSSSSVAVEMSKACLINLFPAPQAIDFDLIHLPLNSPLEAVLVEISHTFSNSLMQQVQRILLPHSIQSNTMPKLPYEWLIFHDCIGEG